MTNAEKTAWNATLEIDKMTDIILNYTGPQKDKWETVAACLMAAYNLGRAAGTKS